MTLQQKLAAVQTEFKSKKSRFNSFGKYYFRSAEDILEAIKPFLLKYGITVTVDEELVVEGPVPVIKTTATIHDEKGMTMHTSAIVGVDLNQKGMQVPQQFGSASSYGKKYALGNLFLIEDTKDSDATNTHGVDAATFKKAQDYVSKGGNINAIKKKYTLTPEQEKQLTTL